MAQVQSEVVAERTRSAPPGRKPPRLGLGADGTSSPAGLIGKIVALGIVGDRGVGGIPADRQAEPGRAGDPGPSHRPALLRLPLPRPVPAKYLIPGTLFLVVFQIIPVLYTVSTAFTNVGDAHRGSKQEAIQAIGGSSVRPVPGSAAYTLSLATDGDAETGDIVFLLTDPATKQAFLGTSEGLEDLPAGSYQQAPDGRITSAEGYTLLSVRQANARSDDLADFGVPTERGSIKSQGLSRAFEGTPIQAYEAACDCIKDSRTGNTWTADNANGLFVDGQGQNLAQGWPVNVGLRNVTRVLTDGTIRSSFLRILVWNFAFAIGVVALTFALGLLVAMVLDKEGLRGQRIYRSLIILPYAMPAVAMMLVWRDMFNTDFGLINRVLNTNVNWFGTTSSMFSVLLVQLWLGYNYMVLVCTGALQAVPADLSEAAQVDGARPFYAFRTITFPLLLVAVAPLLIASFAFNFNNFTGIYLVSGGGPFPPDNPQAGGTNLLFAVMFRPDLLHAGDPELATLHLTGNLPLDRGSDDLEQLTRAAAAQLFPRT